MRLSACIIARDEERDLPDCLASVAFCDEVVVVDSGSTDRTVAVAEAAGARIVHQPWLGFSAQRNVALDHARGDWVLEVDADERLSPALQAEVAAFVADPPEGVALAALPRREVLVGHVLGPSAKYPNYCHRLLRRGAHRHDEARTVHEGLVPDGPVHPFGADLLHALATSWRQAVADHWRYAALDADQLAAPRSPAAILTGMVLRPAVKLAYRTTVDGGWRDGAPGLAKVGLDVGTDVVVWARHALGRSRPAGRSGATASEHYGVRQPPAGSVRVLAVGLGARAGAEAAAWAAAARAAGLDAAAAGDRLGPEAGPRARVVAGAGPLALLRALEAEEQLRTLDAVVPVGRRARRLLALAPPTVRGRLDPPQVPPAPDDLARRALAARERRAAA